MNCLLDQHLVRYTPPLITFLVCCQEYCRRRSGSALGENTIVRLVYRLRWACAVDAVSGVRRRGSTLRSKEWYYICRKQVTFGRHTSQETNNTHKGAHPSEWGCDHLWNRARSTRLYTPQASTGEGERIRQVQLEILWSTSVGRYNVKRGYERRLSMGKHGQLRCLTTRTLTLLDRRPTL